MKRTYQCQHCPNQVVSIMRPSKCEVCGSNEWSFVEKTKPVKETEIEIPKEIFDALFEVIGDVSLGIEFESTIENFCEEIGWKINKINDDIAILGFNMESGNSQVVFIIRHETTLEFFCPSKLKFDSFDEIYHYFSSLLLRQNAVKKIGFWCLKEVNDKQVFSVMHNAEINLINVNYFYLVVKALITECDTFEQSLDELARKT